MSGKYLIRSKIKSLEALNEKKLLLPENFPNQTTQFPTYYTDINGAQLERPIIEIYIVDR